MYMYVYVCMYVCMYVFVCMYVCIGMYVCMYVCMYDMSMYVCTMYVCTIYELTFGFFDISNTLEEDFITMSIDVTHKEQDILGAHVIGLYKQP